VSAQTYLSLTMGRFGERSCRAGAGPLELRQPRYSPVIGAALYAARLSGSPLGQAALERLTAGGAPSRGGADQTAL